MANTHGGARQGAGRKPGKVGKAKKELAEKAKEHAPRALEILLEISEDKEAPHSARVSAANSILDRGYGKPPQSIDHSSEDGSMTPPTRIELVAAPLTPNE